MEFCELWYKVSENQGSNMFEVGQKVLVLGAPSQDQIHYIVKLTFDISLFTARPPTPFIHFLPSRLGL